MLTRLPVLTGLADRLRTAAFPLAEQWLSVDGWFTGQAEPAELRDELRAYLQGLEPARMTAVLNQSRETTTHFAWCLLDRPDDQFSFWLHEYKPQFEWRAGYADSIHNHRYHFCTMILAGGYQHERYQASLDEAGEQVHSAELIERTACPPGMTGTLLAHEFHRIPKAVDNTMTFLVKSRPVRRWSLSFDPLTGATHRHIPVENRFLDLVERL